MSDPISTAQEAWGEALPDWVLCLAEECAHSSQVRTAKRMDRSGALVNQVLKNKYQGDLKAVEDRVRGVFMAGTISCPALGSIPSHQCQDWRKKSRKFINTNSQRVRMFRACAGCQRNVRTFSAISTQPASNGDKL